MELPYFGERRHRSRHRYGHPCGLVRMTPVQLEVLDHVREMIAVSGWSPTIREIGSRFNVTVSNAHRVVEALVQAGHLTRSADKVRNLRVADLADLRAVPTAVIAAELARRGVTLAALNPNAPRAVGQRPTCAANGCPTGVERGHLMCRRHWLMLPPALRTRILQSNARRDQSAFERAVTDARDLIDNEGRRNRA